MKDVIKKIKRLRSSPKIHSHHVQVGTQAIKCEWTREMVNEISSMQGIDASSELESLLARLF